MKWIALTGGLGTGKSTVAQMIRQRGYLVLDADQLAKDVVKAGTAGLKAVVTQFGSQFLNSSGELDRQQMAQLVFNDANKLKTLEAIIHPLVQLEVQKQKDQEKTKKARMCFYDVPLYFEKKLSGFDAVLVISSNEKNQYERLRRRNAWTDDEIQRRLSHQVPLGQKIAEADFVIHNDGTQEELQRKLDDVLESLLKT